MTLRVIQIVDTLKTGGAQSLLATLAESLPAGEIQLDVVSLDARPESPVADRLRAAGVAVHTLGGRHLADPLRFMRLWQLLRTAPYDLVHTHLTYANILGVSAAHLARRPVIATLHNVRPSHHGRLPLALEGRALTTASVVIAVGERVAAAYHARRPGLDIRVILNAVAPPSSLSPMERRTLRATLAGNAGRPLLIAVGRLTTQKGYPDLIAAMGQIVAAVPDTALVIAGRGDMRVVLEAAIRDQGLEEHVFLLGLREDVPALLAAADLFVSAAHWEGLPVALLEAMAAGLPVVATAVGDVPSVVSTATGLLVPAGKPEGLAGAIIDLLGDHERRVSLGQAAAAYVADYHGVAAWTQQIIDLYADVVSSPGRLAMETS